MTTHDTLSYVREDRIGHATNVYVARPRCHVVPLRPHWHIECSVIILQSTLCANPGDAVECQGPQVWQNKLQTWGGSIWAGNWLVNFIMASVHIVSGQQITHITRDTHLGHLEHQHVMPFSPHLLDYILHWPKHSAPCREAMSLVLQSYLGTLPLPHCFLAALIKYKLCLLHTIETGLFLH